MQGSTVLVALLVASTSVAVAQDRRVRTATHGATQRTEQAARSDNDREARGAQTVTRERPNPAVRSRARGRNAARRNRESDARRGQPRMEGRRNDALVARRVPAPRTETQRRRRAPIRRRAPKIVHPRPHPKPAHRRGGVSIDIDIAWPWPHRHRRRWAPRYRYRQVVHVHSAWGRHRRSMRLDVRTRYHHRVRRANAHRAEVDVYLDAIELYADGRYVGSVDRIPRHLSRVRTTLYRSGRAHYDRELFLVGNPHVGFELIATRPYDRFLLGAFRRDDWIEAGRLDLYDGEVIPVRRSRLFHPHDFDGIVPVSLLPEELAWRCDVGRGAISIHGYRGSNSYTDGAYYYGRATSDEGRHERAGRQVSLRHTRDDTYHLDAGAHIEISGEAYLERVE